MSMLHVSFNITLGGLGKTVDECWQDAITEFSLEPGPTPEKDEYEIEEEDEVEQ